MNRALSAGLLAVFVFTSTEASAESLGQQVARLENELAALKRQVERVASSSGGQGAKGERGEPGPPGPKGDKGDPGSAGTPRLPLIIYNKDKKNIMSLDSSSESGFLAVSNPKGITTASIHGGLPSSAGGFARFYDAAGNTLVTIGSSAEGHGFLIIHGKTAEERALEIGRSGTGDGYQMINGKNVHDYADVLEVMTRRDVEPGMVMAVAGPEGQIAPSAGPYDRRVVGVISGAGGLRPASIIGSREDGSNDLPVAVSGQVAVRVCLEGGPIAPGDLLVASSRAGVAMRAADPGRAVGAVVGKALEAFGSDQGKEGLVRMMVMLR